MTSKVDELVLRVEAVLFASGKPLSISELTDALEIPDFRPVQRAVKKLAHTYEKRQTALEVRRVGDRYALQLRETFVATAHSVTPVDLSARTLKALTLIAYHQPILQSVLARMIGDVAYEEVHRLQSLGLVHVQPKGATLELITTRQFAEYFGISSTNPQDIRVFLEQKLGVSPGPRPPPGGPTPGLPPPSPTIDSEASENPHQAPVESPPAA